MEENKIIYQLYLEELRHHITAKRLAYREGNPKTRKSLEILASEELTHAREWHSLLKGRRLNFNDDLKVAKPYWSVLFLRNIVGLSLGIKMLEHKEKLLEAELSRKKNSKVARVFRSEHKEDEVKSEILEQSTVLSNIRDIIFGMNDGLVEILAATAGIAAAIQNPLFVLIAGLIVAVSGTLSMAGGAYLSTDYENTIGRAKNPKYEISSPGGSAFYVGIAYIIGALFPLLPFIFGLSGYTAIAISITLTAIILLFSSATISLISDTSITERAIKTLIITLGISAITIIIGFYARTYLHISI